jgi:hypothetical protein
MKDSLGPSRSRASRRWLYVLVGASSLVVAVGAAVLTFPQWGRGLVREAIVERLAARIGGKASLESVEIEFGRVVLHDLTVHFGAEGRVTLRRVDVLLDEAALWDRRVEVVEVSAGGGYLGGSESDLQSTLDRLRSRGEGGASRIKLRPRVLAVDDLHVELSSARAGGVSLRGRLDATVDMEKLAGDLRGSAIELMTGDRGLTVDTVRLALSGSRAPDGPVKISFPVEIELGGAAMQMTPEISIAGAKGTVTLADSDAAALSIDLHGGFAGGDQASEVGDLWSIRGDLRRDFSSGHVALEMAAFELGKVPQVLDRLPLVSSETATVGGTMRLDFEDGKIEAAGEVDVRGLNINHPLLASEVVRDVGFSLELAAAIDPANSALTLARAVVRRDAVAVEVDGELVHPSELAGRRYRLHVRVPAVPCKDVLAAIPVELASSLQGFELAGKFEMDVEANVELAALDRVRLGGKVGIDSCVVKGAPPRVAASRLNGPFTHRAVMRDGQERVVELHPGSGTFTGFAEISPYMTAAVLTTEDGGFWRHKGFLPTQFEAALRRNVEAGRIRLGASTISMQMVKNVLLSHERTLARKFQEMFLTWYVERALSKERIMEIYLNVVEFGPGIYGVTRASAHYFGKQPGELTPPEAAYLALMLPTPVRRHVYYCEGALDSKFRTKHRRILAYMNERGRLDDETYAAWKEVEIVFDRRELGSKRECLAEIKRLLEAGERQRARSGLLDGPLAPDDSPFEGPGDPSAEDAPGAPAMDDFMHSEESM